MKFQDGCDQVFIYKSQNFEYLVRNFENGNQPDPVIGEKILNFSTKNTCFAENKTHYMSSRSHESPKNIFFRFFKFDKNTREKKLI